MTTLIRDLDRFKKDCVDYQKKISGITDDVKRNRASVLFEDFLLKVQAVDQSVIDMTKGYVAVNLQHNIYVDDLKKSRLNLHNFLENLG